MEKELNEKLEEALASLLEENLIVIQRESYLAKTPEHISSDARIDALKAAWAAETRHLKSAIQCFYDEIRGLKEEAREKNRELVDLSNDLDKHLRELAEIRNEIEWQKDQLKDAVGRCNSLTEQNEHLTERCNFLKELLDGIDGALKMLPSRPKKTQLLSAIKSVMAKLDRRKEAEGKDAGKRKKK